MKKKLNNCQLSIAFFDTDAHPNNQSFLAVAKAFISDKSKRVFQLPVFQVRNFWSISNFSKLAALGQAFSHQTFCHINFDICHL